MIDDLLRKIEEAIKGFFAYSLIGSLEKLTGDINDTVLNIGTEVAKGPQDWNSDIFSLIRSLSDNVILPLAGILITYVLVYELYHMVVDNNNMKSFEPSDMVKYLIKACLAVLILSHTFEIAMAIFDVAGHVVQSAISVISDETAINIGDFSSMRGELMDMELYEVVAMWAEAQVIGAMVWVISIVIMVILFGRMLEIYLYISVAPLPFAAFGNRELSGMSQNYVKGLVEDGETITLLADIDYDTGILIKDITVTFELNGFNLKVVCDDKENTALGDALEVDGGTVILDDDGGGEFNITSNVSDGYAVHVHNGGKATVTNVVSETDDDAYAVYAEDGAAVTVKGDVIAVGDYTCGVSAYRSSTVIVNGNVSATSLGNGNVYGVDIAENSTVTVGGDVSATGKGTTYGVCANVNSTVTVEGTITATSTSGTLTWYASSADAASGTSPLQSTDATQFNEEIDSTKTLYWRFVADPAASNYIDTAKTGSTVFTIVEGDPQDITFPNNTATATYGDAPITTQTATNHSSASEITYRSDNTAVATVADDGTVTIVGAGTAVIYAKAAAVPGTWAETEVSYTLTVNPKDVAITGATITAKIYDGTGAIAASTVTPTFDDEAGIGSNYTVSAASVTGVDYGVGSKPTTVTVTLTGTTADNYNLTNATYTAATVDITAKTLTITGVTATNRAYIAGNTDVTLTGGTLQNVATADAGNPTKLSFTLGSGTIVGADVGDGKAVATSIALTGTSAGNYTLTQPTGITVNITAANQATLTIDDPGAKTYGDAQFALTTTGGSGTGAVSFTVISGPGTINDDTLTITGAGSIVVTATKAAVDNYNAVTSAELTIAVGKANQATLSVTAVTGKKFGDTPFALATTGGDGTGALSFTVFSGPGSISGNILTITGVGDIFVTATKAADDNYEAATSAQQTITIAKGDAPIITWPTASDVNYGDALSASTLSFTSNAYGTFAWTTPTTIPTVTNSGYSVTFTPSADTLANYEAISPLTNTVSVTVTPKNVSALTIEAIAAVTYTGSAHEPSLTVKDGGTVLSTPGDYTVSYSNNTAAGTATVTITGAGNYTGTKQTTFTIKKAIPATLSWPTAGNITYGAALLTSSLTGGSAQRSLI